MPDITALEDYELLSQVAQAYRTLSEAMLDHAKVRRGQANVLCKLFTEDGITQTEIAQQLSLQGATVTDMLKRMEESGLISRRRDPQDNRLVRVYLTEAGRQKEESVIRHLKQLEQVVLAGFNEAERLQARQMLIRMLENMSASR